MFLPITNSVFARALRWRCLASPRPNIHRWESVWPNIQRYLWQLVWANIHRYLWESVCTFDRASYTANTNMHPLANIAQTDSKHWLFCTSVISERTSNYDSHAENWPSCYEISKHPVDMHIKCISICCWHFKQILATKTKRTKIINKISKRPTNECICC